MQTIPKWNDHLSCFMQPLDILIQLPVEGVARQGGGIAQDDELHAGTGDGYVHPAQVVEKPDLAVLVGTHQADEDYITLLSLETVDRIDRYRGTEGLEERVAPEQLAEVLHLCLVRSLRNRSLPMRVM